MLLSLPEKIAFIDLDDMAGGEPLLDAINLMAHLHLIKESDGERIEVGKIQEKFLAAYT